MSAILSKLDKPTDSPANHFYIHNNSACHKDVSQTPSGRILAFCEKCSSTINNGSNVAVHTGNTHIATSPRTFPCEMCDNTFENQSELQTHSELEHTMVVEPSRDKQSGNIFCDICDKAFTTQELLREHAETNHETVYISCENCNYSCKSQSHLNYHIVACHPNSQQQKVPTSTFTGHHHHSLNQDTPGENNTSVSQAQKTNSL